jgi:hypothetical protein
VQEIVVGVDVLQQMGLLQETDASGRTRRVQLMGNPVRFRIEGIVVLRLVDADAPQKDRRMIPVLQDHFPEVRAGSLLPFFIADVLPAGELREDQKADLVAAVDERLGLRIMRGTDGIAAELVFQDIGIFPLQAVRHGIADVGIGLMTVEAAQADLLSVQIKAVRPERHPAEAEPDILFVQQLSAAGKARAESVEHRTADVPAVDRTCREPDGDRSACGGSDFLADGFENGSISMDQGLRDFIGERNVPAECAFLPCGRCRVMRLCTSAEADGSSAPGVVTKMFSR